jgi:hypothetical protein
LGHFCQDGFPLSVAIFSFLEKAKGFPLQSGLKEKELLRLFAIAQVVFQNDSKNKK